MTTAYLETRAQKSIGSSNGAFGGPDTYIAVQVVPDGTEKLVYLNRRAAKRRGITIHYFGEGYSKNQKTERSMLGRALVDAQNFVNEHNVRQFRIGCRESYRSWVTELIARETDNDFAGKVMTTITDRFEWEKWESDKVESNNK